MGRHIKVCSLKNMYLSYLKYMGFFFYLQNYFKKIALRAFFGSAASSLSLVTIKRKNSYLMVGICDHQLETVFHPASVVADKKTPRDLSQGGQNAD